MTQLSNPRDHNLLDGRRVTVSDLVAEGLLAPGERLVFERPLKGGPFHATVTDEGRIRLGDGREYRTPSPAASDAAECGTVDGWHAWVVEESRISLGALRQQLLDLVASSEGSAAVLVPGQQRHEMLKRAAQSAVEGTPEEISVRDLIGHWNAARRSGRTIDRVAADLENHGLVSDPDFRFVSLDSLVKLVAVEGEAEPAAGDAQERATGEPDVGITLGNIPSALGGVTNVAPSASLEEAMTVMRLNDFSQLAVLAGERSLRGAVTWQSIANAVIRNPKAGVADALIHRDVFTYDRALVDVLDRIVEDDFVFVTDQAKKIAGIVTAADVVVAYGTIAIPFFLVGQIDRVLRQIIASVFSDQEIAAECDPDAKRGVEGADDMSFGDYARMLEPQARWKRLGWHLDRVLFVNALQRVRVIRNDIVHFNRDSPPAADIELLRNFATLLNEQVR